MRGSALDASHRSYLGLSRGVVTASADSYPVQTVQVRLMANELLTAERYTAYGFHSVPPPADSNGANGAEVVVAFMHGNRSDPIVVADIDRRTKPKNWKPGDSGHWHYQGASHKLTTTGFAYDAGPMKQPHAVTVGNCTVTWADGTATIKVGDKSTFTVTASQITGTVNKTSITISDGRIDLGGAGGSPVATQAGFSTKVFALL